MVVFGGAHFVELIRMLLKAGAVIASFSFTDWATGAAEDGDEAWVQRRWKTPHPFANYGRNSRLRIPVGKCSKKKVCWNNLMETLPIFGTVPSLDPLNLDGV